MGGGGWPLFLSALVVAINNPSHHLTHIYLGGGWTAIIYHAQNPNTCTTRSGEGPNTAVTLVLTPSSQSSGFAKRNIICGCNICGVKPQTEMSSSNNFQREHGNTHYGVNYDPAQVEIYRCQRGFARRDFHCHQTPP